MANKRLGTTEIDEMKNMVIKGVYPEDIAKHFDIAVSSVHNYKKRFKDQGVKFPSVKGKRPSDAIKPEDTLSRSKQDILKTEKTKGSDIIGVVSSNQTTDHYRFIVNGISIEIGAGAKSVNIGKDYMEIKF